jgi:glycerophosphoryl diester phosphodiesterase
MRKPLIYAHRGSSGESPENTLSAFRLSVQQGAAGIELDVQMTADGQLVVIHDEMLDRTTSGQGFVAAQTYEEIRRYDASYIFEQYRGETVPLLSEVLMLLEPTGLELNIELKNSVIRYEGMEDKAIRLVREFAMESRVTFSSFNHYSVAELARKAPEVEAAILYEADLYRPWEYAAPIGARALHPWLYSVNKDLVTHARQAGMRIRPWTCNTEDEMQRMIEAGVDAIITNYPLKLKAILT